MLAQQHIIHPDFDVELGTDATHQLLGDLSFETVLVCSVRCKV